MNLRSLTFRLPLLVTLFASGCAEPPVPEDPYQEESEAEADDSAREPSDDEAAADDDTSRDADADEEADDRSPADDQAAPNSTRDAGSARDAGKASNEPEREPDASADSRTDDAATAPPAPAAELDLAGLFSDGGLLAPKIPGPPSPDNPVECPSVAPDNPIGPCIGVPVYATCTYGTYVCLCDWVHWLCI